MSRTVLLVVCLLVATLLSGCAKEDDPAVAFPAYGVALSPRDFGEHFPRFWTEAEATGSVIAWAGPIHELDDRKAAPNVIADLNEKTGFHTAIMTGPYSTGDKAFYEPYTNASRETQLTQLVAYMDRHEIAFLALGVEVDILADEDPQNYTRFVAWWQEAYDAVKDVSPETYVFPVFQYERMIGLKGGLYGGFNGDEPSWRLLDDFPSRDLTVFTTYPGLIYKDPRDIPSDHYAPLEEHVVGDIGFTEIGWHAGDTPENWGSGEEEQARFVDWFFANAPEHVLALWLHLYDTGEEAPFDTMGLLRPDGVMRPALGRWRAHTGA